MARRTKSQIMAGVKHLTARIVANNTIEYERPTGERVIRLHLTDIVVFNLDRSVSMFSGGWTTVTTKERINRYIPAGWSLWQEKNEWFVSHGRWSSREHKVYHWHEGFTIFENGTCDGELFDKEREKKARAWQRRIKRYAKRFIDKLKAGEIPAPGAGDCWMCSFVDQKDRAWGENAHDDHVHSHVIENYYVPSLVVRATKQLGLSGVGESCLACIWHKDAYPAEETEGFLKSGMASIGWEQIGKAIYRYCLQWAPYDEEIIDRLEKEVA